MAKKITGCGTVLSMDETGVGDAYVEVSLVANVTAPEQVYADIESNELASCENKTEAGMEEVSVASFTQYWEPGDTDHLRVDTAFTNKTVANWKIEFPAGYAVSQPDIQFDGYVRRIAPQQLGPNDTLQREVEIVRKSAITQTAGADV
jgi:hypothetical protein